MQISFDKTIEEIEGKEYPMPSGVTNLVKTIYNLKKKPLKDYSVEDLRVSIGQNIVLPYLIPLAIKKLKENILSEGNFYPCELLNNVLSSDRSFWVANIEYWNTVK
jgi:CDI immunity proteins